MAHKRETPLIGISGFGRYDDDGITKIPMGTTEAEGFEVWEELTRYNVVSGYTGAVRKSVPQTVMGHFVVRLQDVDLANVRDLKGLPASALTGDLHGAEPTKEVLSVFADELGTQEFKFYCEGPGPEGPREVIIGRAVVENPPRIKKARNGHTVLEAQFLILEDGTRKLYDIEDNL
jgi:hypothetical protein